MGGKVELNSSTAPAGTYSPVADAPAELLTNIFSRLPNWDLSACTLVCHRWENRLNETEGLKQLFMRKFPSVSLEGIADADLKKEYIQKNRLDWNYRLGLYFPYVFWISDFCDGPCLCRPRITLSVYL